MTANDFAPVPAFTVCRCGHPVADHQTGVGPWTGFCYGTLGQLGSEYVTPGADPAEPCACESPVPDDGFITESEARALDGNR